MTGLAPHAGLWLAVLFLLCGALLLRRFLVRLVRLLFRSCLGLGVLGILSQLGFTLGVNCFNALVLGLLGIPGFGLLLLVQWALR